MHVRKLASALPVMLIACLMWQPSFSQESTPESSPMPEQINRSIAIYPEETGPESYITVELEPGESTEVKIVVGNTGEIDQTIRTYSISVDSAMNGGLSLPAYGSDADAITSWIDYPEQELTFKPTEGISLPVKITVPEDAQPGEYVTAIAAEQSEAFEVEGTNALRQRVRWNVPILIVVPGELSPVFEVGATQLEWHGSGMFATIGISNTGNAIVRPVGEVRLLDADGNVIGVSNIELGSIYTGTETVFQAAWPNVPQSENYTLEIVLATEDGSLTVEQSTKPLSPLTEGEAPPANPLLFSQAELVPLTRDNPPSTLQLNAVIANNGEPIENARVSIVTYQNGEEVDRYPILQAVTIGTGTQPVEARYSLPGGFTDGTYTFEVTIEIGDAGSQTVLVTQPLELEITAP